MQSFCQVTPPPMPSDTSTDFSLRDPSSGVCNPPTVAIVGGGPAGLMAAETLANAGLSVTVFEAKPSLGRKFLRAGIGSLNLTPGFTSGNVTYTATTSAASNTITATPANAGAKVKVEVGGKEIENGKPATWSDGSNTVTITVTAADGETVKTYTVTVTKS